MSTPQTKYYFQPRASLLPLLHAARYPSFTVIGCLLGPSSASTSTSTSTSSPGTAVSQDASTESKTTFEHAIPLIHHWTGLSMAIEAGLGMVRCSQAFVIRRRLIRVRLSPSFPMPILPGRAYRWKSTLLRKGGK